MLDVARQLYVSAKKDAILIVTFLSQFRGSPENWYHELNSKQRSEWNYVRKIEKLASIWISGYPGELYFDRLGQRAWICLRSNDPISTLAIYPLQA